MSQEYGGIEPPAHLHPFQEDSASQSLLGLWMAY
jgi:hypothetical protein